MAQGFLLGPDLLARTRRTIETVEGGVIGSGFRAIPTVLEGETPASQKVFRICEFTGAWAINASKVVTFKYQTATPNTAVATNLFFPFPAPSGATDCAIARDGTAWYLIDVPMQTATAVFVASTASQTVVSDISSVAGTAALVSGISVAAVLNTSNCAITVSTTQTTSAVTFVSTVTKSTATIAVVQGTFTATFLSFKVS